MLNKGLLADRRVRAALGFVLTVVGLLLLTQLVFPGSGGASGRGTPLAILFQGLPLGFASALTATGIILIYRTIRVINFAQGALGVAGALFTFRLVQYTPVPFPIALILGLITGGIVGLLVGLLALRFAKAPRLVLTVFSILAAGALGVFSGYVTRLPFFPEASELSIGEQIAQGDLAATLPFGAFKFELGDLAIPFGFPHIFAIELGLFGLLAVAAFFRYTKAGVAVRASAENSERASLLGIGVGKLSLYIWIIAGALSACGAILTGVLGGGTEAAASLGADILLPALAAAILGRMSSLPITAFAAVAISVMNSAWNWSFKDDGPLFRVILFVVVAIGLLLQRKRLLRSEQAEETSSWVASQEQRPVPKELDGVTGLRIAKGAFILVGILIVGVYPFAVGTGATNLGGVIALNAITVISMVVLTGWAGQVSLGQFGFVALGSVIGGSLSARVGLPFLPAVIVAALIVAGLAVVIGLPALRIRGLFLLVVTFGFAVSIEAALFNERYFGWLLPASVNRPKFVFLDFEDERSMYYLCVVALVAVIIFVSRLRRTRVGRNLIGVRDNEANVRSFGVNALKTKLLAFAVAGGLAGFSGAIFAHQARGVSSASFTAEASVNIFTQAVFGGIGSVSGALLGAGYFQGVNYIFTSELLQSIFGPLTTLALLYAAPAGLISLINRGRDSILSIIAQRRKIIVPSLVTNYDVSALKSNITPLADPLPSSGLAAVGAGRRFTMRSGLYADRTDQRPGAISEEAEVIGAAASAASDRET